MLRAVVHRACQASHKETVNVVPQRGFKRVKISMGAIRKAQETAATKKKAALNSYYGKLAVNEKGDKDKIDERQKMQEDMAKGKVSARRNMRKIRSKGADMSYMPWREQQI